MPIVNRPVPPKTGWNAHFRAGRASRHGVPRARQTARARRPTLRASIVIMAKEPVMGRVKTRLGKDIGPVAATYFYRHGARAVMLRLAQDPRWNIILSLSPDTGLNSTVWPKCLPRMKQGRGDLGQRMQRIFDRAPGGPVLIMGTDIPQVRPVHLGRALRQLGSKKGVFGAAGDGGYWLVGQSRVPRVLRFFQNVRWSTSHALDDTIANLSAGAAGYAPTLGDVDDGHDYERVRAWSGRVVLPAILYQFLETKQ